MAIELLNNEHWSTLVNTLSGSKKCIKIISPFIGFKIAKLLKKCIEDNKVECTLITRFYREDFLNKASSLEGLKLLVNAGVEIYALQDLHIKLYLFDDNVSIIGSANFTMGGFKLNHELSLMFTDEDEIINSFHEYYDKLLMEIQNSGNWLLNIIKIEEEITKTDNNIKNRKDKSVTYSNNIKFGAKIKGIVNIKESDYIEEIIGNQVKNNSSGGIWLKFEGTGEKRVESNSKYTVVKLGEQKKTVTCFPRNPRSISNDDVIYLAALSWDKDSIVTPMIVARAKTMGFNSENIATEQEINSVSWLSEYPYYCELYNVEIIDTVVENCISLNSIIKEVGTDLYPNSVGKDISTQELKARHHQKSHIKITAVADEFISFKFEEIKLKYGLRNI